MHKPALSEVFWWRALSHATITLRRFLRLLRRKCNTMCRVVVGSFIFWIDEAVKERLVRGPQLLWHVAVRELTEDLPRRRRGLSLRLPIHLALLEPGSKALNEQP